MFTAILLLRTYALMGRERRILSALVLQYAVTSIDLNKCSLLDAFQIVAFTTIVVLTLFLKSMKCEWLALLNHCRVRINIMICTVDPPPLPSVVGCYMTDGSLIIVVPFILLVFNETGTSSSGLCTLIL
jgi:hypothetical protein